MTHPSAPSRRQAMRLLLGALAAASPACATLGGAGVAAPSPRGSVLIIGAGIAGLAAAEQLAARGLRDVIVLEARDRIGGRIHSVTRDGLVYDMGASWIHGMTGNPITQRAGALGLQLVITDHDERQDFDERGAALEDTQEVAFTQLEALLARVEALMEEGGPDRSLADAIAQLLRSMRLSDAERAALRYALVIEVEQEYAAPATALSARFFDEGATLRGQDAILPQGLGRLCEAMRGFELRLDHEVDAIEVDEDGVEVRTSQGALRASHVIVTLPLGVLKQGRVRFTPQLSAAKRAAIERLGVGLLHKTWLRFSEAFWSEELETPWMGLRSAAPERWSGWLNLAPLTGAPVLLALHAGEEARRLEAMSDAQIAQEATQALGRAFGASIPAPTQVLTSRWGADPHARGSYSFLQLGATPADRDALRGVEHARLHFAGEATSSTAPATIHGAYAEGRRAAAAVLAALTDA